MLNQMLRKMNVRQPPAQPRRRRRRQPQPGTTVPGAASVNPNPNPRRRRNRRARNSGAISADGTIRIRRCELLADVSAKASVGGHLLLKPDASQLVFLNGLANSFDRIVWHSARVFWRSAVGTTTNGTMTFGPDWNNKTADDVKLSTVSACTPLVTLPIWQSNDKQPLVLPSSKLMTRKEYSLAEADGFDSSPATILYFLTVDTSANTKAYGNLWVEYDVTLSGTKN